VVFREVKAVEDTMPSTAVSVSGGLVSTVSTL